MKAILDQLQAEISLATTKLARLKQAFEFLQGDVEPDVAAPTTKRTAKKQQALPAPRRTKALELVKLVESDINGMTFKMNADQAAFLKALDENDYVSREKARACYPQGFKNFYRDIAELRSFAALAGAEINTYKGPNRGYRLETT